MNKPRVFLDSSVIIAALLSSRGGSFYILTHLHEQAELQINEYVFAEVRAVLEQKFADRPELASTLFLMLGLAGVETVADPSIRAVRQAAKLISKNDAPILSSAMTGCNYLITLDKEFFKTNIMSAAREGGLTICTPGDFIQQLR
ncbi:MAG TPA: type II toxin-antitoxin system VapC family toxin [Candidatus Paceibacterota bacterium]